MAGRKKRPRRRVARRLAAVWSRVVRRSQGLGRAASARLRPWRPEVEVDLPGKRGRRLRRAIARAARSHLRALRVTPPGHLLVVVQRTVVLDGRPLASLLQVFEGERGPRRHVLFLAASTGDRKLGDGEVVAALRHQLQRVVAAELGAPVATEAEPVAGRAEPDHTPPPSEPPEPTPLEELASSPAAFGGLNGGFPARAGR
ncbi:MAG: hypothetical protein OXC94_01175 [Chloroflexi bacterium]|nr:hypothetical protein [Chloroflexota bacterium]